MTRLHRLPVLAVPAMAMVLGMAAPAFAQTPAVPPAAATAPSATAPAMTASPAMTAPGAAPGAAAPDATAPGAAPGAPTVSPTAPGAPGSPAPEGTTAAGVSARRRGGRRPGGDHDRRQPVRPERALERRRLHLARRADHPGDHVAGHLVHHDHQVLRAGAPVRRQPRRDPRLLDQADRQRGRAVAEVHLAVPLHRRHRHRRHRAPRGHAHREHRPERVGHDVDPALGRADHVAPAGRPRLPGHRRLHRAVRRPVRHRLGHLPRADRDRHRRPGLDRQGRRPRRRGADHDRDRPRHRGAGGARLQLAGPPQQGRHRAGAQLLVRPALDPARRRARRQPVGRLAVVADDRDQPA